jgi:hypothetical protein
VQFVTPAQPFSFRYIAFDQASNLFVLGRIYDVTSGVPVLITTTPLSFDADGVYSGNFSGDEGKSYLIVAGVYTDANFTVVDPDRAPASDSFFCGSPGSVQLSFDYAAFDQDPNLLIAAKLYDVTGGSAVFIRTIAMTHVALGVYFGCTTGVLGKSYVLTKLVYTDSNFTSPDFSLAPGGDSFQCFLSQDVGPQVESALREAGASLKSFLRNQSELFGSLSKSVELISRMGSKPMLEGRFKNRFELRGMLVEKIN